ncbi:MAG: FkbM family methyltransferase [bacterium]|nr:FkbM family methyltransferase [bacterium]
MIKKIISRLSIIIKSLPNILLGALFEYKKHPWTYIFSKLFLSVEYTSTNSRKYFLKYFKIEKLDENDSKITLGEDTIIISNILCDQEGTIRDILLSYFDIIYSLKVKYPISVVCIEGPYENEFLKINDGDYIIDAGANFGLFSFSTCRRKPNGKVFSFEPIKEVYSVLEKTKAYNNIPNINNINQSLGIKREDVYFKYDINNPGGSHVTEDSGSEKEKVKVEQNSIDNYVFSNNIPKIDFIKMDIEGEERNALNGARETILKFKPRLSICTYHYPEDKKILTNIIKDIRNDYVFYYSNYKLYAK